MRLDKYICESTDSTRQEAKGLIKAGLITIDGVVCKKAAVHVAPEQQIALDGERIEPVGLRYIMMNKPVDTLCTTSDTELYQSVISLMLIDKPERLHIAGRLDVDSTGLILITDDGLWSHKVTSPRRGCFKTYLVELLNPVSNTEQTKLIQAFADGFYLSGDDKKTLPAEIEFTAPNQARVKICEGRFHQVKRMFLAFDNQVTRLHRQQIGEIVLGTDLAAGEWRYLNAAEINSIDA
ncbi:pseudouridine synthase [Gayadomonas joobiniege]|uniref:pseudouridine synthase n=1 Tax=Gayadomonas joobiniege TaxID=1234606 RepID=UPI000366D434|nr:pseudouridine synthase [Gayadomonas joobiniege]